MINLKSDLASFAIVLISALTIITGGCNSVRLPAAPASKGTAEQPQGVPTSTGGQASAVPDSAEPAGSQVQFK